MSSMCRMFSSIVQPNHSISFLCLPTSPLAPNKDDSILVRAQVTHFSRTGQCLAFRVTFLIWISWLTNGLSSPSVFVVDISRNQHVSLWGEEQSLRCYKLQNEGVWLVLLWVFFWLFALFFVFFLNFSSILVLNVRKIYWKQLSLGSNNCF